jgi:mRNA interferase MazF
MHDWPAFRVTIEPSAENGLRVTSQVMIDKTTAVPRDKIGSVIGHVDAATMRMVSRALVRFVGADEDL